MQLSAVIINSALLALANAHCKITYSTSNFGGVGVALGLESNDHTSSSDVTLFLEAHLPFGATQTTSAIDPYDAVPKAMELAKSNTLPQIDSGSTISMNVFQINEDGAGPMRCFIDGSGKGDDFTPIRVTIDVPGSSGMSSSTETEWPLEAVTPASVDCKGAIAGVDRLCFVKCVNPRGYGGTIAVQQLPKVQNKFELRSEESSEPVRREGKQGNKPRGFDEVKRQDDSKSSVRKEGKQGNKARDEDVIESEDTSNARKEGKQGNKARSLGLVEDGE